jgi:hypothetical protein
VAVTWITFLIKKEKNMFALSHSVAAQTATLASVRLFASRLYFVLLLLSIVVKVFISMRAHIFFSDDAKKSLFHFYSRDTPSAKRAPVCLSLSRPLSISRGVACVFRAIARADSLMLFLSASLTLFFALSTHKKQTRQLKSTTRRSSSSKRASTSFKANAAGSEDDDFVPAQDSSRFRQRDDDDDEDKPSGLLGDLVSNLPTLRKEDAPESYGSRPESKTLKEGRYKRPTTVRVGNVDESTVRGEDFEIAEGGPGIGLLVTLLFGAAVLGGVYLTVQKLQEPPAASKRQSRRMPASDKPALKSAPAPAAPAPSTASSDE